MFDYSAHPELLKGRIILVTGAARGIGAAAAKPTQRMARLFCCWAELKPAWLRSMTRYRQQVICCRWSYPSTWKAPTPRSITTWRP